MFQLSLWFQYSNNELINRLTSRISKAALRSILASATYSSLSRALAIRNCSNCSSCTFVLDKAMLLFATQKNCIIMNRIGSINKPLRICKLYLVWKKQTKKTTHLHYLQKSYQGYWIFGSHWNQFKSVFLIRRTSHNTNALIMSTDMFWTFVKKIILNFVFSLFFFCFCIFSHNLLLVKVNVSAFFLFVKFSSWHCFTHS